MSSLPLSEFDRHRPLGSVAHRHIHVPPKAMPQRPPSAILGFLALAKGQRNHGRLLLEFTNDEIEELIDKT